MPEELTMDPEVCASGPMELKPFVHQVGGHTSMFHFNETTLCKPQITREHCFYEMLPQALKEFTPEYYGVIEVELFEDDDGYITLVGFPIKKVKHTPVHQSGSCSPVFRRQADRSASLLQAKKQLCSSKESYCIRALKSGNIEVKAQTEKKFHAVDPKSEESRTEGLNPWSLKCHQIQLAKMKKMSDNSKSCKFILLENVAAQFHYPCILDLKMGTRQHGDDATEEKKLNQIEKCKSTTSSSIGVRVCGMQVFQANTGKYVCHNKYYGRSLSVDGFKKALFQFLHNGCELSWDLIQPIICRLEQLYSLIEKQDTFRFYSSSLLIMYDGVHSCSSPVKESPFEQNLLNNEGHGKRSEQLNNGSNCWGRRQKVDVRMIDFAHVTHSGFKDDKTSHQGPDRGYIFGLQSLLSSFKEIRDSYKEGSKNQS